MFLNMGKRIYSTLFLFWITALLTSLLSQCPCQPLAIPGGTIDTVNNVSELSSALDRANSNNGQMTIILNPGIYQLTSNLLFISSNMANLTIRGATGNRQDVTIKGQGWNDNSVTHIFNVAADSFTLADVTIGEVYYHPIQIHSNDEDADYCHIQNVRIVDAKEQFIKVSGGGTKFADDGKVLCCLFEFTSGIGFQYYTGGIDAHRAKNWMVKHNTFKHIRSPDSGLAEHAIHFWRESAGTIVDGNIIINCDRGIGFGLGNSLTDGHMGGLIMNNFVHTSRDVGIGLESAPNAKIYNNTVVTDEYFNSIEYRFPTTNGVHIANNLTNEAISDRSSGSSGTVEYNVVDVDTAIFVNAANYDYHLSSTFPTITDAGIILAEVDSDIDCNQRYSGAGMDIGADEYNPTTPTDVLLNPADIILFPNPTPSIFNISGILKTYSIQILDATGKIFMEYEQMSGTIQIDISNLPNALYFIKIQHDESQTCLLQKILKSS